MLTIVLGNYVKIVSNKFQNEGVKTVFKVKDVLVECQLDEEGNPTGEQFYVTTFEFTYNNKLLEESIQTNKNFELNQELNGIYLPTGKINKISVAGEGVQPTKGAEWALIGFGLFIIALLTGMLSDFKPIAIPIIIIITFVVICGSLISMKLFSKRKK